MFEKIERAMDVFWTHCGLRADTIVMSSVAKKLLAEEARRYVDFPLGNTVFGLEIVEDERVEPGTFYLEKRGEI